MQSQIEIVPCQNELVERTYFHGKANVPGLIRLLRWRLRILPPRIMHCVCSKPSQGAYFAKHAGFAELLRTHMQAARELLQNSVPAPLRI